MKISPLAHIDPKAQLAPDVEVGPFCVVGPNVHIDGGTRLLSHVVVTGHTTLGRNNVLHPNAVLGGPPQDKKYADEPTRLEVGDDNHVREGVTMHVGTERGGGVTRVGSNNLIMCNVHFGHDANVGSNCVIANNCMIAGHVVVGSNVAMMGGAAIHHFVRIGDFVYIGGYSEIHHDVPPYVKLDGEDAIRALNKKGLERAGFSAEDIDALDDAFRRLFLGRKRHNQTFASALASFDTGNGINGHVRKMVEFLRQRDMGKHGRYLESFRT